MAVIGGIVFAQAVGPQIPAPFPRAILLDRPGTDGRAVRMMPAKSESVQWETVEWVLLWADAVAAQGRYDLLRGGFVTTVDDVLRTMGFVVVQEVQVVSVQPLASASPPANYAVRARWTLVRPA